MNLTPFDTLLGELLPLEAESWSLDAVALDSGELLSIEAHGAVRLTLRLFEWQHDAEGRRELWSLKEQQCYMASEGALDDPERFREYLTGWAGAAARVLREGERLDFAMPCDLVAPRVLDLATPRSADDFERAMLVRSRLGRFLPLQGVPAEAASVGDVDRWLGECFPVVGSVVELHLLEQSAEGGERFVIGTPGTLFVDMEVRYKKGRRPSQQVQLPFLGTRLLAHGERLRAFLHGWTSALRAVFSDLPADRPLQVTRLDCTDTLRLHSTLTAEDFERACLTRGRLGRLRSGI